MRRHRTTIFARQPRASAAIALDGGGARGGVTRRARVHEDGSLRVRFPNARRGELRSRASSTPPAAWPAATASTLDIAVGDGARARRHHRGGREDLSRARRRRRRSTSSSTVGAGARARLAAAGDHPVRPARGCSRRIEVDLADDARLLLAEAVVFGRTGDGRERSSDGALHRPLARAPRRPADLRRDACGSTARSRRRWREPAVGQRRRRGRDGAGRAGRRQRWSTRCARCATSFAARSASRPGTALRSCGSARATARRCATTSSLCSRALRAAPLPRLWLN